MERIEIKTEELNNLQPIPFLAKAEPGWKILVRYNNEIKAIDVLGWRIRPVTIGSGMLGLGSTIVLASEPMTSTEFAGCVFLGELFDPSTSSEKIEKSIALWSGTAYPPIGQ